MDYSGEQIADSLGKNTLLYKDNVGWGSTMDFP